MVGPSMNVNMKPEFIVVSLLNLTHTLTDSLCDPATLAAGGRDVVALNVPFTLSTRHKQLLQTIDYVIDVYITQARQSAEL